MDASYPFDPERFELGVPCSKGHRWETSRLCLRYIKGGRCVECERARRRGKPRNYDPEKARQYYLRKCQEPGWIESHREYTRTINSKPEHAAKRRERKNATRTAFKEAGLTACGTDYVKPRLSTLQKSIRDAGKLPTVQQLVLKEQLRYWKENPEEAKRKKAERQRELRLWRYRIDLSVRIYNREKSKRRKALQRGSVGLHVTATQIRKRFNQFGNLCAYCGSSGDLHIEHVIPISRGGNHVLGNIIPACQRCNYSKSTNPVEEWYRSQVFFCSKRWSRIKRILGLKNGSVDQMSLL